VLRQGCFDAAITFTTKPNIVGAVAARLAGIPRVVIAVRGLGRNFAEPQTLGERCINGLVARLYRIACSSSTVVWFTNRSDSDRFVRHGLVDASKVLLTRNAIDLSWFSLENVRHDIVGDLRREFRLRDGDRAVVMVARMIWPKGIREFIDAAKLLRDRLPDVRFILVGPSENGSAQAVPEAYLRQAEHDANFQWVGFRGDVREVYALAEVAVLPSYYKEGGYPRALLEPMALRKPVIAADTDDCRGPVEPGSNGYLVPPRDATSLAEAVSRLMTDKEAAVQFGQHSRKKIEREFDERIVVEELLEELTRRGVLA
jgi:glycosyltransferase involved in cell wall biosynthesis